MNNFRTTPFIIYALPRSRTAWLARLLTYGEWHCGHEEMRHARSLEDVAAWFRQPNTGTVETAAAPWWRLIQQSAPDARTVVIRRPVPEVVDSLARLGFAPAIMAPFMVKLDRKLDQIERRAPGVLSFRFRDLESESTCREIFEYCLPYQHDPQWWGAMSAVDIQVDMRVLMRYFEAYEPQLTKLAKIARNHMLAGMVKDTKEIEGLSIQEEQFEIFFRDAIPLFRQHSVAVGEVYDSYLEKNWPMFRRLEEAGALHITTARSNGRMFGYLLAVISPSLEWLDRRTAVHTLFFGSPEFPGIGMKLQRASIEGLRARGVDELHLAGRNRGAGPKLGSLYRRLGAEETGQWYKLDLREAV